MNILIYGSPAQCFPAHFYGISLTLTIGRILQSRKSLQWTAANLARSSPYVYTLMFKPHIFNLFHTYMFLVISKLHQNQ